LSGFFASKKYKKKSTEGVSEMVAKDGKGPDEGPAVGMQLGRGNVNFSKERALEPREWQVKLDPLEDCGVHKEEGFFEACTIFSLFAETSFSSSLGGLCTGLDFGYWRQRSTSDLGTRGRDRTSKV